MSNHRRLVVVLIVLFALSIGFVHGQAQEATVDPVPVPTEDPTSVPTENPTPTATEASPEQTVEPTASPETTAEATDPAPTATPDTAPTDSATVAPTDEPTPSASSLEVVAVCLDDRPAFIITNHGPDMTEPAYFERVGDTPAVDDATPETPADNATPEAPADEPTEAPPILTDDAPLQEEPTPEPEVIAAEEPTPGPEEVSPALAGTPFTLASGESITVTDGTGLRIGDAFYAADPACANLTPELSVSASCVFETGVAFTIENSGGAMTAEQAYEISSASSEPLMGAFLLGSGETVTIEAGFGEPAFASDDLASALDAPCYAPAQVSGVIWDDADRDGARAETELGIPNVAVQLIDPAGFTLTAVTAADGSYGFGLLPTASFIVRVDATTLPPEYTMTAPASAGDTAVALDVLMGLTYTADFGFAATPSASISGTVWLETGNFGVRDGSEMGVAGAMVELFDEAGAVIATVPVDGVTGAYAFSELYAGPYTVRLAQATLFTPIGVTLDPDGDQNFESTLTLEAGQALSGADFGVVGTF